jgi:asparagine synthase (glutamine-hydrolysing)
MEQHQHIRNNSDFNFIINEDRIVTENKCTLETQDGGLKIYLHGIIYNQTNNSLIDGLLSKDPDFIKEIEGSFVIFTIEDSNLQIITDKVNSKKAYYSNINNGWYISNNIDLLPKQIDELSIDGMACYLANGHMFNNLTLFRNIKVAERASVTFLKGKNIDIHNYWKYEYNYPSNELFNQDELMNRLEKLLIDSVTLRYSHKKDMALSLSAGFDARGILGILYHKIKAPNVKCFSYSDSNNPKDDDDAKLSQQLANYCGYTHETKINYHGDFISYLIKNAKEGKCIANMLDEIDAWNTLTEEYHIQDLFVGEACFGSRDNYDNFKNDVLNSIHINDADSISWMKKFIKKQFYMEIHQSLIKLNNDIWDRASFQKNLHDKKDFLYLDQRINHVLMPWREIIGRKLKCFVHNPYLDGRLLEFMKSIPPQLRKNKNLFRNTITRMFPDLFLIPKAKFGNITSWRYELIKNKHLLIQYIQDNDSPLDRFISKSQLIKMLNSVTIKKGLSYNLLLFKFVNRLRSKNNAMGNLSKKIFSYQYIRAISHKLNPERILIRLLILRIYLSSVHAANAEIVKEDSIGIGIQ